MYGPYYESLAAVPNRELSTYLPGRDAAKDAEPIPTKSGKHEGFLWDKKEFSFEDFLDTINPLHHIPVISTIYRETSGDTIGAVPRVLGGALYGLGPVGAALGAGSALINVAVEAITGKDVGGTMMAFVFGEETDGTAMAQREAGTSSALGQETAATATPVAANPDNAAAADHGIVPSPAEELRIFPGVNLGPAKRAADVRPADRSAGDAGALPSPAEELRIFPGVNLRKIKSADDKANAAPSTDAKTTTGKARTAQPDAAPAAPSAAPAPGSKDGAGNAWVSQSILSGLEKYRAMARDQGKKPAQLDAVY